MKAIVPLIILVLALQVAAAPLEYYVETYEFSSELGVRYNNDLWEYKQADSEEWKPASGIQARPPGMDDDHFTLIQQLQGQSFVGGFNAVADIWNTDKADGRQGSTITIVNPDGGSSTTFYAARDDNTLADLRVQAGVSPIGTPVAPPAPEPTSQPADNDPRRLTSGGTEPGGTAGEQAAAWGASVDQNKLNTALGTGYTRGDQAQIIDSNTGAVYYLEDGFFTTLPDASGATTRLYLDGDIVREVRIDRTGRITGGWVHQNGKSTTDNSGIGTNVQQITPRGVAPPLDVRPPATTSTGVPGNTLTQAERNLISNTQDQSTLIAYVGADGKVHVARAGGDNPQVVIIQDGTVETAPGYTPPEGQSAPATGTRVIPRYIAQNIFANAETARVSTTSVNGQNQYVVETSREDKGVYVDYRRTVTSRYEEGQDGAYTVRQQTVDEKNDVFTAGYSRIRETNTFAEREKVGDNYVNVRTGNEISIGNGRTVQIATEYDTARNLANAMTIPPGASTEERARINADRERLTALDDQILPKDNLAVRMNGETIAEIGINDEFVTEGGRDIEDVLKDAIKRQNPTLSDEEVEDLVDDSIVQARADREARHGSNWADGWRRRPGETGFDHVTRVIGNFIRTYDQFGGIQRLSTLFMGDFVQENREKLAKSFCGFAGLQTCLVSSICGQIHEITADNVLVGTEVTGERTNSAALNAERSEAVVLQGLSRQELLDILGNTSTIGGRFVDLTDPNFNPNIFGALKLRLYHVEYSISNRLRDEKLMYNLEFRRLNPPAAINTSNVTNTTISLDEFQGSYQDYVRQARNINNLGVASSVPWYPKSKTLEIGKTDHEHEEKYSTNEYDAACLVFTPGIPVGKSASSETVKEFCVPFTEYTGGATTIGNRQQTTGQTQTPPPSSPARVSARETPGSMI